jgi:hypothetical protein
MDKNKCPKLESEFTFWKKLSEVEIYILKLLKEDGGLPNKYISKLLKEQGDSQINIFQNCVKQGFQLLVLFY